MKKVVRLTEEDLVKLVKQVLSEQGGGYNEMEGTTDNTAIINVKVLKDTGLPCDETNYKKMWVSTQLSNYNTTTNGQVTSTTLGTWGEKNLSKFKLSEETPPTQDYLAFKLWKYVKDPSSGKLTHNGETKVLEIKDSGKQTFNTYYSEPDGSIWKIGAIKGSGNGLLALARALMTYTGGGKIPNRITIGLKQTTRVSTAYSYDPSKINNINPTLNGIVSASFAAILRKNDLKTNDSTYQSYNQMTTGFGERLVNYMYSVDDRFIPKDKLVTMRNQLQTKYDSATIDGFLNVNLGNTKQTLANAIYRGRDGDRIANSTVASFKPAIKRILEYFYEKYKQRIIEYIKLSFPAEFQQTAIGEINVSPFSDAMFPHWLSNHIENPNYLQATGTPGATSKQNQGTYERGQSGNVSSSN